MYGVQTHNYELDPEILSGGLERLDVQIDDLRVELFACPQQHIFPLYSTRKNSSYYYYWQLQSLVVVLRQHALQRVGQDVNQGGL